jgi:hypothetical protein
MENLFTAENVEFAREAVKALRKRNWTSEHGMWGDGMGRAGCALGKVAYFLGHDPHNRYGWVGELSEEQERVALAVESYFEGWGWYTDDEHTMTQTANWLQGQIELYNTRGD